MAQLNRYSFAGYYFNQPNVKVRQVTKGSPPLRGSNFIAPGRTGEIWTPKKHGGRMLTLEILVIDEPRGTARMIFDQIQQLAATRTQGALVNYLDSGPRTAQAEIVNWTAQDIDNVGLVFVGQLDFYLADPWFYGATVSGSVVPTTTAASGSCVTNNVPAPARSAVPLALTGVVSGQPIIVGYSGLQYAVSSIADTFAGHYTWTKIEAVFGGAQIELWIGTGGTGTSGTVTITAAGSGECGGWALPLSGASTAAAMAAVDVHGDGTGTNTVWLSLTPTAAGEIAVYASSSGIVGLTGLALPWVSFGLTDAIYDGARVAEIDYYLAPTSGAALAATWSASRPSPYTMQAVGAIIKTLGASAATLTITNPGTVLAEKLTLDFLGPITNPTIRNTTNGLTLAVAAQVAAGTHLIIDTGAVTVTNGVYNAIGAMTHAGASTLMALNVGANVLSLTGSNCTGSTLVSVSFAAPYE
jgi:hypothetical protein